MEKVISGHLFSAALPLALLAALVVAILGSAVSSRSLSAQHPDVLTSEATSQGPYIESKFELATSNPSRDTAFYSELGFRVVAKTSYGYITLKSGPVVIALSPVSKTDLADLASISKVRRPPIGVEIVLYTSENLEEEHKRLKRLGLKPTDIRLQPWGVRDFRIADPGGYYIRISEGHAIPVN
jgi:lactoylglutathione lyase